MAYVDTSSPFSISRVTRLIRGKTSFIFGCILLCVFITIAIGGDAFAPNPPNQIDLLHRLGSPSLTYPLGTDHLGRCILSRLISGTALSLGTALATAGLILSLALPVGLVSALMGGWIDAILMRVADIFLAFPTLVFALAIIGYLGASLTSAVIGVALAWWPSLARLIRTLTLDAASKDYVLASRQCGQKPMSIVIRHIFPQILPPLLVVISLEMASLLLVLASLSFLGLGAQPPAAEWGAMLNEARPFFAERPGVVLAPGLVIILAVLSFNLVGEGIRFQLDKRKPYQW
ncbi:ABC transporter permease subunit [Pseudovibrio sp. Tun.PSC04-5.I4]|uniref:ABC transporter permease n=1 Tax=Pseudovibrio sp. Tun.PSC04-5.I4 TaxID=1798213 RepID=UPI00088F6CC4|nr:ABC transporter permease subunit [Pseudovibrio sp. Tun.PSC04-5.I4]SDQ12850.1 peptide/nickel transport system permease protein [Pseudovibrio sp. Tun.PSC04-5.I4]